MCDIIAAERHNIQKICYILCAHLLSLFNIEITLNAQQQAAASIYFFSFAWEGCLIWADF